MIGGQEGGPVGRWSFGMVSETKCDVVDYCAVCECALYPGEGRVCRSDSEIWCFDCAWSVNDRVVNNFALLVIAVHDCLYGICPCCLCVRLEGDEIVEDCVCSALKK